MATAAKLASIASSSTDQKAKTDEYKALLASLVAAKDIPGLTAFVEHSTVSNICKDVYLYLVCQMAVDL